MEQKMHNLPDEFSLFSYWCIVLYYIRQYSDLGDNPRISQTLF